MVDVRFMIPALSAKSAPVGNAGVTLQGDDAELTEDDKKHLSEKESRLKAALERWVADREYCRGDVGVDDIVLALGTNRNFFRYYFRTRVGVDFRVWRNELRVAEAKRMIAERPDISLDEVCRTTGFNYLSNLHRQFEKITGTTPAEYKRLF